MSSGYRDELSAAEERLARLDETHGEREARERRAVLESQRAKLSSERARAAIAAFYIGLFGAVYGLKAAIFHPTTPAAASFVVFLVATLVAAGAGAWLLWTRFRRKREHARIEAELRDLAAPHVRVAPATLAEAHARIAEREAEEQALGDETEGPSALRRP